jgi:hypothetical protein
MARQIGAAGGCREQRQHTESNRRRPFNHLITARHQAHSIDIGSRAVQADFPTSKDFK